MVSDDDDWGQLRRQLNAAKLVARTNPLLPKSDYSQVVEGFTKAQVRKVASFIVDACEGDILKAVAYARRFENTAQDRLFGRAVRVAVQKKLNA